MGDPSLRLKNGCGRDDAYENWKGETRCSVRWLTQEICRLLRHTEDPSLRLKNGSGRDDAVGAECRGRKFHSEHREHKIRKKSLLALPFVPAPLRPLKLISSVDLIYVPN